jgi:outer membrane protein assembly factor BamB
VVVVVGESEAPEGNRDFLVRAYNRETGDVVWEDRVDPAGGWDTPVSVVVGGPVVIAGGNVEVMGRGLWLVRAYSLNDGRLLWEDRPERGA